jgi:hypothetical protein
MVTRQAVELFCIPAFIWRPTRGGLLNLAKPAQKLLFFGDFFSKFQGICVGILILFFELWRNFRGEKKRCLQLQLQF